MWRDPRLIPFLIYGFLVATCQTAQQQTLGFLIIDKLGVSPLAGQGLHRHRHDVRRASPACWPNGA